MTIGMAPWSRQKEVVHSQNLKYIYKFNSKHLKLSVIGRKQPTNAQVRRCALIQRSNPIGHSHYSWNWCWVMKPSPYEQTEGWMCHQSRHTIYYWPLATWRLVIHDNTFCFVCHKFGLTGNTKITFRDPCYLFIQGGQALNHLCSVLHIFTDAPQGVIHQI